MSSAVAPWRERLVAHLQREAKPAHKYGHQPRLYALTQAIAAHTPQLAFDDDVVFAAAFLHDLGVFIGHRPDEPTQLADWDHVAYACEQAPMLLPHIAPPPAHTPAGRAPRREHQPQDEPRSPEATLLRDADILEQLGAVGILRTAAKLDSDTRFHLFADVRASLRRALETLTPKLRLPAAQKLAQPRIAVLQAFLLALEAEAGEHLG